MSRPRPLNLLCTALLFAIFTTALPASTALGQEGEAAEVDEQYRTKLLQLLEIQNEYVSYADNVAFTAANETLGQIAASGEPITEEMSQIVLEEAQKTFGEKFRNLDFLIELLAPVYARHFTQADLDAMVAFWSTPTGRKNLEVSGALNQESFVAIQQVTFDVSPAFQLAVDARLRELGYQMTVDGAPPGAQPAR